MATTAEKLALEQEKEIFLKQRVKHGDHTTSAMMSPACRTGLKVETTSLCFIRCVVARGLSSIFRLDSRRLVYISDHKIETQ